jgi:hypothetical protein
MSLFVSRLRTVGRRRGVLVFAVSLAVVAAVEAGVVAAGPSPQGIAVRPDGPVPRAPAPAPGSGKRVIVGHSYKNDSSRPVRSLPRSARPVAGFHTEASPNPRPVSRHQDALDAVRQSRRFVSRMPGTKLNFDGIPFPGVACNCAPPDTNGEAGLTQYVQIVNQGFQVFSKSTGAALTPVTDIAALWAGFGGVCETGFGDPIVMYDQLANRWLISQFAGTDVPTDECIAISKTSDAAGAWWRYGFNLGTHFFDYPHLGVWPDAYYMSMNVFDENPPNDFLGPEPFAFDRAKMLTGEPATFIAIEDTSVFNSSNDSMLPADLDGSTAPPAGAPNPFLMSGPFNSTWPLWRFHADFATPTNSTFTVGGTLTPAPYTALCLGVSECVPQKDVDFSDYLDGLGDRGMFRLAYRNFGSREALVGNMSVQSNGVAGIRWYEINRATSGAPSFVQQSTYQPDTTWRWMGSVAMDRLGNLALGFSASSPTMNPAIRYAGRLAGDPPDTLAQGEATLFAGTGSQQETNNRWGDYSDLTVDPVDDCTFWYTQEYYASTAPFAWRTRIGSFRLHGCAPVFSITTLRNGTGAGTVTSTPAGVSCGATCSAGFDDGTRMTLTATPAVGSSFIGWSGGGCAGTGVCTFVLNGAKTITATFTLQTRHLTVGKKGNGRGTVTSSPGGIGCGATCSAGFPYGTALTLTAKPTPTSVFSGWTGACAGKGACSLSLTTDQAATATFKAKCVVPKVLGLTLKKAKARIKRAHCTVGKITRRPSAKSKRGRVLAQKPKPGKRLAPGARVKLTVGRR